MHIDTTFLIEITNVFIFKKQTHVKTLKYKPK